MERINAALKKIDYPATDELPSIIAFFRWEIIWR